MAEEHILTDPLVTPATSLTKYKVTAISLDNEGASAVPGVVGSVSIRLKDNLGGTLHHQYTGQTALDYIRFINTGNFTTKSLQKRILERLSNEGVIPGGTVSGAPDPVTPPLE